MDTSRRATLAVEGQSRVIDRGRSLLYFGGCDYLRLSVHPKVTAAAADAASRGLGVAASRVTTGNDPGFVACERELARFFQADACALTATGYMANLALAQALAGRFTHVLMDERAHVSLRDAAALMGAHVREFCHLQADALEKVFVELPRGAKAVVMTDGLFPLDGVVPPFSEYWGRLGRKVEWWIDDCHAAGTLGRKGRGSIEYHGGTRRGVYQTITLSKALGAFGGAVLADHLTLGRLWSHSRSFAGSSPPPLPMIAAARQSLKLLASEPERLKRLQDNRFWVKQRLVEAGVLAAISPGPMFLVTPKSPSDRLRIRRRLLASGIHPPYIQYPGTPAGGAFRFAVSSEHRPEELALLVQALTG